MGSATAKRSIRDAVARSDKVTANSAGLHKMIVENGTVVRIPHIQAPIPAPVGAQATNGKLQLVQAGAADTGSRVLTLKRITEKWHEGDLTWKNKPAHTSTVSASVTVTGAGADGRIIEFDVLDDTQDFLDGVYLNWGWVLESSNGNSIAFYTSEAVAHQPTLKVSWSDRPQTPTDLTPAGAGIVATPKPLLRWAFTDLGGDTTLDAVQVQIKGTSTGWTPTDGFASPTFDSGETASGKPQFALASSAYAGIGSGAFVWWTCRHRDGSGKWSPWAAPEQVGYQPYETVSMTAPIGTINDTTFPWAWGAAAQVKFQLLLLDANGKEVWDSKIITSSSARTFTQPRGVVKRTGQTFTPVVRVWESLARRTVPGFPAYVELVGTPITYADTTGTAPVTGLAAEVAADGSTVNLTWSRSTPPDQFTLWLGDDLHTTINGTDALVSGTSYAFDVYDLPPRTDHVLTVKAVVVDGSDKSKSSSANPTVEIRTDPIGVRLVDVTTATSVVLLEEGSKPGIVTTDMPEEGDVLFPVGSSRAVPVTSALRWFEGSVSNGILTAFGDTTATEYRDLLLAMKGNPTGKRVLIWGRRAVPIFTRKINAEEVDLPEEQYKVSFEFVAAVESPEYAL